MSLLDPLGIRALRQEMGRLAGDLESSRSELAATQQKLHSLRRSHRRSARQATAASRTSPLIAAGSDDRLTADWPKTPVDVNEIVRRYRRPLVARSRERFLNDGYGERYITLVETNVIGANGITLRSRYGDPNDERAKDINRKIQDRFARWCRAENCDVAEQLPFDEQQRLFIRTAAVDGEALIHYVSMSDRGAPRLAIQILDPELLDQDFYAQHTASGGFIFMGVEFDSIGRPVAYWIRDWNAGPQLAYSYARRRIRVDARSLKHALIRDMPGQIRGLPWMTSVLWCLRQLGEFENATLAASRYGAEQMGFIRPGPNGADEPGLGEGEDAEGNRVLPSGPAELGVLNEGDELVRTDWRYPDAVVEPYIRQMLRRVASGTGTSYNMLANDLVGVNFSSIRHGVQDQQELWKGLQAWTIRDCPDDVFHHWLQFEVLQPDFDIPLSEVQEILERASWHGRTWGYVNPLQDIQAKLLAVANGVGTYSEIIRESGRDPEDVRRELAEDLESMRKQGIIPMTAAEIQAVVASLPKEQEAINATA